MSSFRHVGRGLRSSKLWNTLATVSGFGALVQQATSSDISGWSQSGYWNSLSGTQKLEGVITAFVSRVTNGAVNPFPLISSPKIPSWNIGNALNKYTGLGIGALIYKHVNFLPQRGRIGKFALPLIAGGVIGGILDDPAGQVFPGQRTGLNQRGGIPGVSITRGGASTGIRSSNLNSR